MEIFHGGDWRRRWSLLDAHALQGYLKDLVRLDELLNDIVDERD